MELMVAFLLGSYCLLELMDSQNMGSPVMASLHWRMKNLAPVYFRFT